MTRFPHSTKWILFITQWLFETFGPKRSCVIEQEPFLWGKNLTWCEHIRMFFLEFSLSSGWWEKLLSSVSIEKACFAKTWATAGVSQRLPGSCFCCDDPRQAWSARSTDLDNERKSISSVLFRVHFLRPSLFWTGVVEQPRSCSLWKQESNEKVLFCQTCFVKACGQNWKDLQNIGGGASQTERKLFCNVWTLLRIFSELCTGQCGQCPRDVPCAHVCNDTVQLQKCSNLSMQYWFVCTE